MLSWVLFLLGALVSMGALAQAPGPGVPWQLAQARSRQLADVRYVLEFSIPASPGDPVSGAAKISFLLRAADDVYIDFQQPPGFIHSLKVDGKRQPVELVNGHLRVPALKRGVHVLELEFQAAGPGLRRREQFLYTLFVPDNASKMFPCFDQPDLKAKYSLVLNIPKDWTAVSQGAVRSDRQEGGRRRIAFAASKPTSTYLIAFAAGQFQTVQRTAGGREFTMYTLESDARKIERNADAAFELHAKALDWMEKYTGVKYPFDKFDFVLLPAFPFSGMEHPGSVFYNDKSILLDESATRSQYLNRAQLIAHESAHAWFGDLVTMKWFDDVWLKEVFANFMAEKIADPLFPEINHDVSFLLHNYPAAYSVDRTAGTHPIQQELNNLSDAASLYGAIIYSKAPIVMRQLEAQTGAKGFQTGVRKYLQRYAYANAAWADLVAILGGRRLTKWNEAWVRRGGQPHVKMQISRDKLSVRSADPLGAGRVWPQKFLVIAGGNSIPVNMAGAAAEVPVTAAPEWILTSAREPGYGYFEFDERTLEFVKNNLASLPDAGVRAVAWVNLRENLFERRLQPGEFLDTALRALAKETEELTVDFVLAAMKYVYWALIAPSEREEIARRMEKLFWDHASKSALPLTTRMAYFQTFQDVFLSESGWERLHEIWSGNNRIEGLVFSEADEMEMAYALALRKPKAAGGIAKEELERIKDPERKKEFEFVMAAAKGDDGERDAIFQSLMKPENRKNEPWVLDALTFLHHPLHGAYGEKYVPEALEMLPEIKRTGGIFLPISWLTRNLQYHITSRAREAVNQFLRTHPDLNPGLRQKLLQAADTIMRFAP